MDDLIALKATAVQLSPARVKSSWFSSEKDCELIANVMPLCVKKRKYLSLNISTYEDQMRVFYWLIYI